MEDARQILNHYDKNSEKDIICLGKRFSKIELDAMKEGMRRAANLLDREPVLEGRNKRFPVSACRQAILTAAEQLTTSDL